jgi:hypothetical protein
MTSEPDPTLRASDADRDAVAERLREAHAEGRLTVEEVGERLDATFAARTLGELRDITRDLPPGSGRVARTGDEAEVAKPRGPGEVERAGGDLRGAWGTWATAVLVTSVIWFVSGLSGSDWAFFWPVWVAGPWGAVLLARTLSAGRR